MSAFCFRLNSCTIRKDALLSVRSVVTSITYLAAHVAGPVHVQLHVRIKLVLLGKGLLASLLGNTENIRYSLVKHYTVVLLLPSYT